MKLKYLRIITLLAMILSLFPSPSISFATTDASQMSAAGVNPVKVVSAESFTVALDANGAVWTWGKNNHSQLGTSDSADRQYPGQVTISGSPKITDIAAGSDYTLALDSQGNVWEWGMLPPNNSAISTPTLVNGLSGIQQIAAGQTMAMALTSDGKVMTWGSNYFEGELGQGSQVSMNPTPSPVVTDENDTVLTGIKEIAKGRLASYALKDDGTVYQWGLIDLQQNTTTTSSVASVVSGITGATAIVSNPNAAFVYALTTNGVFAWGQNSRGQLGTGDTRDSYTPVQVASLNGKSVKLLSVGNSHALALMSDGSVWGIGDTTQGQLADPQIYWQATEFKKISTVSKVKAAYAGYNNSFFIHEDGTVVASGSNYDRNTRMYGLLGVGYNIDNARIPLPMIPLASSYEVGPKPLSNVSIQVVNNDQLKFTYDIPTLSNFDKIYFDVYLQGGSTASLSESTSYGSGQGVTGVTHTLNGYLPPGTYNVKIHTEYTGDHSVSDTVTYDNNAAGYTVHPGSVTLKVLVKEWNASASADPSVSNSVYGSVYSAPAADVTVTIVPDDDFRNKMTAITSADGVAVFDRLYPGLYHVEITEDTSDEMPITLVENQVYVFGSQVTHTLHIISDTQPTDFIYRPDSETPTGKIGGSFYWNPSLTPSQLTEYRFYFEDGQGNKLGDMIGKTSHNPNRRIRNSFIHL
ncbi:hypothetical protein Back11_44520 [Paenibacillus baekrokdamisoli]|uniref:Uncharacterized protein n=1 Tax=Paenibacillus baekrokdamisoli TaxID=1712516 RepID=A0A3G9IW28_9BACL|nr:hypothetical protein [Paenibacillus baekrokdamisoli]MBB3067849.1 alpha-tubulin suppressor-like RCC1 family protein [Paenibacillus baekrokdamisoli]BBH23107.1 hypothetical protein Back11_44520 [Paenibacillus baekrokdamisoli]